MRSQPTDSSCDDIGVCGTVCDGTRPIGLDPRSGVSSDARAPAAPGEDKPAEEAWVVGRHGEAAGDGCAFRGGEAAWGRR